ncbi:hypothetical protein QOZ80_6BG0486330 [Eleusine coracana subsp. coracana]|nr:hypothetical protein QOZ80_6BG0486330 [Eleusine coracana subsp. coracana]
MPCFVIGAAPHRLFHGTTTPAPRETPTRPPLPPPAPPEVESSDFDFIGVLGEGGFARVFKVRHRRTCEVFALKEAFNPSPDAEEEAEVLRRAASSPSPHVVQCHAVFLGGNDDDNNGALVVSVLELMDAGSLRAVLRRLQRRGFLEPALAEAAHRCLMGLAQLHSRGVAHLDVKPDNFLCNARGDVKIGDFNASRPRAVRARPADVWGLGVTVLELFLGRPPVWPDAVEKPKKCDWKEVICDRDPPSVPEYVDASPELRHFVAACLHKDPARRARVPHLLRHPFVTGRDVEASSRALRDLIVENL